MRKIQKKKGFTLIEILVVIGIIAVLATVVLVAVNPSRQFKLARDSQRVANVTALLSAIGQNLAEHKGILYCNTIATEIPTEMTLMKSESGGFDIAPCLVPNYISSLPFDPSATEASYIGTTSYNTQYMIGSDANGRVTISAVGEITPAITVTR